MIRSLLIIMNKLNVVLSEAKGLMPLNNKRSFIASLLRMTLILAVFANSLSLQASFEDQQAGARASGMTNAFVAIADDADAIAYNPAGLIQLNEGQLTSQYSQLVNGLGDGSKFATTYVGYAMPLLRGYRSIGFSYQNFNADNLFNERTLILSYGHRLDLEPYGWRGIFSLGANVKQLHREYQPDRFSENALNDAGVASQQKDQLFASGNSKDTFAGDLGALAQFGDKYQYTAGLGLTNINQPDVSLAGDGDKAPLGIKAGVAYRPKWGTATAEVRRIKRLPSVADNDVAFGLEKNIPLANLSALMLRGGYATGSRNYKEVTLGMSYLYSRFRLDYAFMFPISTVPGVGGSHRLGFAFRMGATSSQFNRDYSNADLLDAFAYDSLTTHMVLTRFALARNIPEDYKDQLMLVLMRKYPLDDVGLRGVRGDMRVLLKKYSDMMDWSLLKMSLVRGVPEHDKLDALTALDDLAGNDAKSALMRLSVLPMESQRTDRIAGIMLIALSELAARAYRADQLDSCIDSVRRITEVMPQDEIIVRGYRQLLARRLKVSDQMKQDITEAPATLVAPQPVVQEGATPAQQKAGARDALVKAYGTSLGYYFMRKASGATSQELISLLNQILVTYKGEGLDMSMVERELSEFKALPAAVETPVVAPVTPKPEPVAAPVEQKAAPTPAIETLEEPVEMEPVAPEEPEVVKPAKPEPAAKPVTPAPARVEKPVPVVAPAAPSRPTVEPTGRVQIPHELERAWRYYEDAAARDISDHEKLEILQEMLRQFGEQGAARINRELERIRRRLQ